MECGNLNFIPSIYWKDYSFFRSIVLVPLLKNQLTRDVRVYLWTLNFILLVHLSILCQYCALLITLFLDFKIVRSSKPFSSSFKKLFYFFHHHLSPLYPLPPLSSPFLLKSQYCFHSPLNFHKDFKISLSSHCSFLDFSETWD